MASSQHTLFGGALAVIVAGACIAGLVITGGPGQARKEKEDAARLAAVSQTAYALACYQQAKGEIPEDLAQVDAALDDAATGIREPGRCLDARIAADPVTGAPFRLQRAGTGVTHICATFAAKHDADETVFSPVRTGVIPGLNEARPAAGEHCFALNLEADLDTY